MLVVNGDLTPISDGYSGYPESNLVTFKVISPDTPMGDVTGVVTDALTNEPIAAASVEWVGLAEAWGDRDGSVLTDANGTYKIRVGPLGGPGAAQGMFVMRAGGAGYESLTVTATLRPDATVNFALTPVAGTR